MLELAADLMDQLQIQKIEEPAWSASVAVCALQLYAFSVKGDLRVIHSN